MKFKVGDRVIWLPERNDKIRKHGTVVKILLDNPGRVRVLWDYMECDFQSQFEAIYNEQALVFAIPVEDYREFKERIADRLGQKEITYIP
jgi:hypothetical protein